MLPNPMEKIVPKDRVSSLSSPPLAESAAEGRAI